MAGDIFATCNEQYTLHSSAPAFYHFILTFKTSPKKLWVFPVVAFLVAAVGMTSPAELAKMVLPRYWWAPLPPAPSNMASNQGWRELQSNYISGTILATPGCTVATLTRQPLG